MRPASSLFAPGRLSNSENDVSDCQIISAAIASAASRALIRSFFISKDNRLFTHLADLFESCRSHESGVNGSGRHVMRLSEFPDILSPFILLFGGHIGDGSLCDAISVVHHCRHRFFRFVF
jgi:hypothetical protein